MKKTAFILSICSLLVAIAALVLNFVPCNKTAECSGEEEQVSSKTETEGIAYFNLDEVISAYQFAIDLQQAFEQKAKGINDDVNRRRTKIENEDKELAEKLNKGLITRSVAEVKYNDLQNRVAEFQQFGQQKQNELAEAQQVILNNIANAVMEYVKKYNATHNYSVILSTQGNLLSQPVVTAAESLNITSELIEGLNAEYQANKSKK